jgi:hypothetical protein
VGFEVGNIEKGWLDTSWGFTVNGDEDDVDEKLGLVDRREGLSDDMGWVERLILGI